MSVVADGAAVGDALGAAVGAACGCVNHSRTPAPCSKQTGHGQLTKSRLLARSARWLGRAAKKHSQYTCTFCAAPCMHFCNHLHSSGSRYTLPAWHSTSHSVPQLHRSLLLRDFALPSVGDQLLKTDIWPFDRAVWCEGCVSWLQHFCRGHKWSCSCERSIDPSTCARDTMHMTSA
jgi:hypothetical protein